MCLTENAAKKTKKKKEKKACCLKFPFPRHTEKRQRDEHEQSNLGEWLHAQYLDDFKLAFEVLEGIQGGDREGDDAGGGVRQIST